MTSGTVSSREESSNYIQRMTDKKPEQKKIYYKNDTHLNNLFIHYYICVYFATCRAENKKKQKNKSHDNLKAILNHTMNIKFLKKYNQHQN